MSVTLRLEGLSSRASTNDIRNFFVGLDIPQGGVHIIGGLDGEAFVDVASWDNAYQALQMSDLQIKNSTIRISVISSEEKQQALENYNKVKESAHGRNGAHERKSNERKSNERKSNERKSNERKSNERKSNERKSNERKSNERKSNERKSNASRNTRCQGKYFLRLDVNDFTPTEDDIRHFFEDVCIKDMVFCKTYSPSQTAVFIMFDNRTDATEGYQRYRDSKIVRIRWASTREWIKNGGKMDSNEDDCFSSTSGHSRIRTRSRSPRRRSKSPRRRSRSPQKHYRSSRRSRSPHRHNRSPVSSSRTPQSNSRSPQSQSEDQNSTNSEEYLVRMRNLSYRAEKEDIKRLFNYHLREDHIVFAYDERGHRTREGFATFTKKEHYKKALSLDQIKFKGHTLDIFKCSKKEMQNLLSKSRDSSGDFQAYVYLRSFPPEVTKSDVKEFFKGFSLNEDDIFLLFDKKNTCSGDVLVKFSSSKEASEASKLDRTIFKDKRIPVKLVYEDRLTSFLDSIGLHMISIDPNECVTQEDDPSEDELAKENDACDDEPVTEVMDTPEDEGTVQKEDSPECVSKEDD